MPLPADANRYLFDLNSDLNNLVSVASKPCKYQIDTKPGNGYNDGVRPVFSEA